MPTNDTDTASPDASDEPPVVSGSSVVSIGRAIGRTIRSWLGSSALYGWLTAEPDPDVIVLDLRETRTVGPVLGVLDRVLDTLAEAAAGSRAIDRAREGYATVYAAPLRAAGSASVALGVILSLGVALGDPTPAGIGVGLALLIGGLGAMQERRDWEALRETRPVRVAIAALEPPEPPSDGDDAHDDSAAATSEPRVEGSATDAVRDDAVRDDADRDDDPESARGRS